MIRNLLMSGRAKSATVVILIAAGFGAYELWARAPLGGPASLAQSPLYAGSHRDAPAPATASPRGDPGSPVSRVGTPYAPDHLDADFVDYTVADPLPAETVRAMAVAPMVGVSAEQRDTSGR